MDRAWELGCTNWDVADAYGDSEDLIGKWFTLHPERRTDIFLATKFGLRRGESGIDLDSTPEYCLEAVERSLRRLCVDYIDLYYCHRVGRGVPIEKTVQAMKKLKEYVHLSPLPIRMLTLWKMNSEGKIKAIGLSEISSNTLRRACAVHPVAAVQVEYNPWDLDIEGAPGTHLMDTCVELGVSIFAYAPLGRGMLAGRYRTLDDLDKDDARRALARFQPENFDRNIALVDDIAEMARRKSCTSSQLVLAWLVRQAGGKRVFVIPGTRNVKRLEENVAAAKVALTDQDIQDLRALVDKANALGGRGAFLGSYLDTPPL